MGLSIMVHLDNVELEKTTIKGSIAQNNGNHYATLDIGEQFQSEATFFMNLEQVQALKKEVAKMERLLKKEQFVDVK